MSQGHPQHLVHSHAHEGEIPGTVDLRAVEGDDTGYGQALFPVPADDPNDPLQVIPPHHFTRNTQSDMFPVVHPEEDSHSHRMLAIFLYFECGLAGPIRIYRNILERIQHNTHSGLWPRLISQPLVRSDKPNTCAGILEVR